MQIQFCIEGDHPLLCCWSRDADPIRSAFCGCVAKNLGGGCAGYLAHPFVENDGFCERMCQVASTALRRWSMEYNLRLPLPGETIYPE